jgi:predicted Mrr-cat superfamily restriction endonuclease
MVEDETTKVRSSLSSAMHDSRCVVCVAQRASTIVRAGVKPLNVSWEKKEEARKQLALLKERQHQIIEGRKTRLQVRAIAYSALAAHCTKWYPILS